MRQTARIRRRHHHINRRAINLVIQAHTTGELQIAAHHFEPAVINRVRVNIAGIHIRRRQRAYQRPRRVFINTQIRQRHTRRRFIHIDYLKGHRSRCVIAASIDCGDVVVKTIWARLKVVSGCDQNTSRCDGNDTGIVYLIVTVETGIRACGIEKETSNTTNITGNQCSNRGTRGLPFLILQGLGGKCRTRSVDSDFGRTGITRGIPCSVRNPRHDLIVKTIKKC